MSERRCKNCTSFKWTSGGEGVCRYNPPTTFMALIPVGSPIFKAGGSAQGIEPRFTASWPPVKEDQWCRTGWEAKDENKV